MANSHKKRTSSKHPSTAICASNLHSAANSNKLDKVGRVMILRIFTKVLRWSKKIEIWRSNVPNLMLRATATVSLLSECLKHDPELDFSASRKMVEETNGLLLL